MDFKNPISLKRNGEWTQSHATIHTCCKDCSNIITFLFLCMEADQPMDWHRNSIFSMVFPQVVLIVCQLKSAIDDSPKTAYMTKIIDAISKEWHR